VVNQNTEFKFHAFCDSQPVELLQQRCHVTTWMSAVDQWRAAAWKSSAEHVSRQPNKDSVAVEI